MEKTKVIAENPFGGEEINPLDDLIEDLDEILADFEDNIPPVKREELESTKEGDYLDKGYQAMIGTFVEIIQNSLKPVTRYVKAIRAGNHARELFELIDFSITPLIPKVREVELHEVASRMESLKQMVTKFMHREVDIIDKKELKKFHKEYKPLQEILQLQYRGSRKAVENILKFYKLMREDELLTTTDIKRFFAIGVPSITAIRKTSASDLSSLSGLSIEKAKKIKNIANWYREAKLSEGAQAFTPRYE